MNGHFNDGLVFGVVYWKFAAALVLLVFGVLTIGCGLNVCWVRFSRQRLQKPPRRVDRW